MSRRLIAELMPEIRRSHALVNDAGVVRKDTWAIVHFWRPDGLAYVTVRAIARGDLSTARVLLDVRHLLPIGDPC